MEVMRILEPARVEEITQTLIYRKTDRREARETIAIIEHVYTYTYIYPKPSLPVVFFFS